MIFTCFLQNEDNGTLPVYKIWNLTKALKVNGSVAPPCLRTEKIALQRPTAIGVSENDHFMAIGFDRGSVSLYRGDISRDRAKTLKTISVGITPITGIAFKQHGKNVQMFVCCDSGVVVYNLQSKDKEQKTVLDKTVAPTRCCALQTAHSSNETHFMVGRDDVSTHMVNVVDIGLDELFPFRPFIVILWTVEVLAMHSTGRNQSFNGFVRI